MKRMVEYSLGFGEIEFPVVLTKLDLTYFFMHFPAVGTN